MPSLCVDHNKLWNILQEMRVQTHSEILVTGQVPISLPKMDTVSAFLQQFISPFLDVYFTQFSQPSRGTGKTGFIPILLKGKLKPKEIM